MQLRMTLRLTHDLQIQTSFIEKVSFSRPDPAFAARMLTTSQTHHHSPRSTSTLPIGSHLFASFFPPPVNDTLPTVLLTHGSVTPAGVSASPRVCTVRRRDPTPPAGPRVWGDPDSASRRTPAWPRLWRR